MEDRPVATAGIKELAWYVRPSAQSVSIVAIQGGCCDGRHRSLEHHSMSPATRPPEKNTPLVERQHLVGIDRTRRQKQQEDEALQLAVRGVWRENSNGEHPTGFWWCSSAQTKMRQKLSERTRSHKGFVKFDAKRW